MTTQPSLGRANGASGCGNDSLAAAAHPSSAASAFVGPLSVTRDAQAINLPLGLPAHALH